MSSCSWVTARKGARHPPIADNRRDPWPVPWEVGNTKGLHVANSLRSLGQSVWSTSICSSDDSDIRLTMYIVLMKETFRHKECFAERITKLCHKRYPPIEVRSFDDYAKGAYVGLPMGIYPCPKLPPTALLEKVNTALSNLRFSAASIVN